MALTTISPQAQQRLAVFVPIVALAVSLFVVYPAWGRYSNLNQQIDRNRKELANLKATPPPPQLVAGKPTVPETVSEPSEFLGLVKRLAAASGCRLMAADVSPKESKTDEGPVRPISAKVEVVGEYRQIRSFLWQIEHAGRLLAVTDIALAPAAGQGSNSANAPAVDSGVRASITLERYVATKSS